MGTIHFKQKQDVNQQVEEANEIKAFDFSKTPMQDVNAGERTEDKSRRKPNAKIFRKRDGVVEAEYYGIPIHYLDKNDGQYHTIDNTLEEKQVNNSSEDEFTGYENKKNDVKVRFAKEMQDGLFCIKKDDFEVKISLYGEQNIKAQAELRNSTEIYYQEFMQGNDLQYILERDKVKENIIIKNRNERYEYSFLLQTKNLEIDLSENEETLELFINKLDLPTGETTKEVLFRIPKPYMYDAAGEYSRNVDYELEFVDNGILFKIIADSTWINAEERCFPVTIDPILFYNIDSEMDFKTFVSKDNITSSYRCYAGIDSLYGYMRTYIKFNLGLENVRILNAQLYLNQYGDIRETTPSDLQLEVRGMVGNVDLKNISSTWANKPNCSAEIFAYIKNDITRYNDYLDESPRTAALCIDVTKLLNTDGIYGAVIKSVTETGLSDYSEDYISFANNAPEGYESFYPTLRITYLEEAQVKGGKCQTTSVGRAGEGSLDLYTDELRFVHQDFSVNGSRLPLNLTHIYNDRYRYQNYVSNGGGVNASILGMGYGWKTNYHQYLLSYVGVIGEEPSGRPTFSYMDANGDEHVLYERVKGKKYSNESGNLKYYPTLKQLADNLGNTLTFDASGRLICIENIYTDKIEISYNAQGLLTKVKDSIGRQLSFNYSGNSSDGNNQRLSNIKYVDTNEVLLKFTYDSFDRLICITYSDGTKSTYEYTDTYKLSKVRDQGGYFVEYSNSTNKRYIKDGTSFKQIDKTGVTLSSDDYNSTLTVTYNGEETRVADDKGNVVAYQFMKDGKLRSSYTLEKNDSYGQIYPKPGVLSQHTREDWEAVGTDGKMRSITVYEAVQASGYEENYLMSGDFSGNAYGWTLGGDIGSEDKIFCGGNDDCHYLQLKGEANKEKYAKQTVSFVGIDRPESLVFYGYAKAPYAVAPHEGLSKFCLKAQIIYEDGTHEAEETAEFNYLERDWQVVGIGLNKSISNKDKKISLVEVKVEYSNNNGIALFDNLQLVEGKFTKQYTEYYLEHDNGTRFKLEEATEISFGESTFSTYENNKLILTYIDIANMLNQYSSREELKYVILDQKVIGQATSINIKIGGKTYDISEFELVCATASENEKGEKTEIESNEKGLVLKTAKSCGGVKKSEVINTYNSNNLLKKQTDTVSKITTEYYYDSYGNLVQKIVDSTINNSQTNRYIQDYQYDTYAEAVWKEYDERGESAVTYQYNEKNKLLTTATMPNGQMYAYSYNGQNIMGITTVLDGVSFSNGISYMRGHMVRLNANNLHVYDFTRNGYGQVLSVKENGVERLSYTYKKDGEYDDGDESKYDYTQVIYGNGYSEKAIYDRQGRAICYKAKETDEGTETEYFRTTYDDYGRVIQETDKGLGETNAIYYTYDYASDGSLQRINLSGARIGQISIEKDTREQLTSKTITFGNSKTYQYNYDAMDRISTEVLPSGLQEHYTYDYMHRLSERRIGDNYREYYSYAYGTYNAYVCTCDRTTNYVESVHYQENGSLLYDTYEYDEMGNIIRSGGNRNIATYEYDKLGRLTRENNKELDFTKVYTYDEYGNIVNIKKYNYTTGSTLTNERVTTYTYDGTHKDRLLSVSGAEKNITVGNYDNNGNACNYGGNVIEWKKGRMMTRYGNHRYSYDGNGIRQSKTTAAGVVHNYYIEGDRIHKETYGNTELWYYYDGRGIRGLEYNGTSYYFERNLQGDVVGIITSSGKCVAQYIYDAWGNHKVYNADGTENTSETFIGNINPFRYRGYYYDVETGLYYLQTRYYDSTIGRFIQSADVYSLNPSSINGLNLYSYTNNNPIGAAYRNSSVDGSTSDGMVSSIWLSIGVGSILGGGVDGSSSPSRNLPSMPWWVETVSTAIDHSFSIINPIRTAGYIAKYPNLWDLMRLDGATELPGTLSKVATGVGLGLSIIGGAIAGYEKYASGASVISSVFGGAINAGISIGGMYAATGLASLAMGAMTAASIPGGIVVVGGAVIAILVGAGLNYLFTEVNFFGNTIEGHLNDFVDWLIFWD